MEDTAFIKLIFGIISNGFFLAVIITYILKKRAIRNRVKVRAVVEDSYKATKRTNNGYVTGYFSRVRYSLLDKEYESELRGTMGKLRTGSVVKAYARIEYPEDIIALGIYNWLIRFFLFMGVIFTLALMIGVKLGGM